MANKIAWKADPNTAADVIATYTDRWELTKFIRLEFKGSGMYIIRIDGVYVDCIEGLTAAKRRAKKALAIGSY